MKFTRRLALAAAASAALALSAGPATAQAPYPSKPITIVVAYPAGGDTDVLGRIMAEKLSARLGQTVIVENRTGAAARLVLRTWPSPHQTATRCCWHRTRCPSPRWC